MELLRPSVLLIALVIGLSEARFTGCPRIISRAEWGARPPARDPVPLLTSPTPYVLVHHGGSKVYCDTQVACAAIVRSYQNYHIDSNGWDDIGYSFVIGEDGLAYEGRGWDNYGAHAPGYNGQSIGICIIGDFSDRLPNEAALETLEALIRCGVTLDKVETSYGLIGHRQAVATLCPGETLYKNYVRHHQHWDANPVPFPKPI